MIKKKHEKMNNENISKITSDKEAKIGCKGGNKFWFGDKDGELQPILISVAFKPFGCAVFGLYSEMESDT
ncbi:MAG: hypothetical protein LBF72_04245 [Holosporales bacterium]|nr:hypothetical protein [Holosporales bacterium]